MLLSFTLSVTVDLAMYTEENGRRMGKGGLERLLESILDVSPQHLNTPINTQLLSALALLSFSVLCGSVDIFNTCRGGNQGGEMEGGEGGTRYWICS